MDGEEESSVALIHMEEAQGLGCNITSLRQVVYVQPIRCIKDSP
jgi:hypothetical protein